MYVLTAATYIPPTTTHCVCPCSGRYKKTLKQLLMEKPKSMEHLLKALEEAIELHEVC